MKRIILLLLALTWMSSALGQSNPGIYNGQVILAPQWNQFFSVKTDWPLVTTNLPTTGSVNGALCGTSTNSVIFVSGSDCYSGSSGTVTSVALSDGSTTPIYTISGSPVTSTGTLTFTLNTETAHTVLAGPSSSTAQPTFRTLATADIPTGTSGATIPLLNGANAWSGAQTFTNSDILLLGSSTGYTTFTSGNSSATNYTLTFPAITSTIATLGSTQTFSGTNTFSSGVTFSGLSSGTCVDGIGINSSNQAITVSCPGAAASIAVGTTTVTSGTSPYCLYNNSGTLGNLACGFLGTASSWTAAQTFTNSDIKLLGSSTGATTFTSANASATAYTLTFPAVTDTLATIGTAQTFTAAQSFPASGVLIKGSSTGYTTLASANASATAYTATFPANTGTLSELNLAQSWSAAQTYTNSDILLLGSSTGATTFTSANASATAYTLTIPANSGTIDELNLAQSITAAKTFTNSDILLLGSSTGYTTLTSANSSATNYTITIPAATATLANLTTTDQALVGGATVTPYTQAAGAYAVDCGKSPLQWVANTGAFTITAPTNDGSCVLEVVNGNAAGAITLTNFSGKSPGGGTYSTTATSTATVTFTNSSASIGWTANGLILNAAVYFTTTGGLPTNFTAGTIYYVQTTGTNTFQVSATPGGAAITAGSAGSGTQTGTQPSVWDLSVTRVDGMSLALWTQVQ